MHHAPPPHDPLQYYFAEAQMNEEQFTQDCKYHSENEFLFGEKSYIFTEEPGRGGTMEKRIKAHIVILRSNRVLICCEICETYILFSTCMFPGVSQAEALKEENDSLRCQLDAYRNEVELLKQEQGNNQPMRSEEDTTHSQQLSFLQQALQGMQKVGLVYYTEMLLYSLSSCS